MDSDIAHTVGPDQQRVWIARTAKIVVPGALDYQAQSVVAGKGHRSCDVLRGLGRNGVGAVFGHVGPEPARCLEAAGFVLKEVGIAAAVQCRHTGRDVAIESARLQG